MKTLFALSIILLPTISFAGEARELSKIGEVELGNRHEVERSIQERNDFNDRFLSAHGGDGSAGGGGKGF